MARYYSSKEIVLRIVWAVVGPLFFRFSPRLCYGWRNFVLRTMGATVGKRVQIHPSAHITFPWLLTIGDGSVIGWGVKVYNLGRITIGSHTVISQYTYLCGGDHDYRSKHFTLQRKGLTVGSHVWIAAEAFIGPGVTIHEGALVAARAVVVKDVEGRKVVAGNPARVMKGLDRNALL